MLFGIAHAVICFALAGSHPARRMTAEYVLSVDPGNVTGIMVELRLRGAPDTLRLAMAAHPEYDDRFWRYVRDVRVSMAPATGVGPARDDSSDVAVVREDSMVWRAVVPGGVATVRYRIDYPTARPGRGSWRAHLSPTTGLIGGPHTFLFVLGHPEAPARVVLRLPGGWTAATGLKQLDDSSYAAPDVRTLLDGPILVGAMSALRRWPFTVHGVPHEVAYAGGPDAVPFDTAVLVARLKRLAESAHALFGGFPYGRFVFQLQDGTASGLEHGSSVSLGMSSAAMARGDRADVTDFFDDAAHEYVHTWNEVHLRPRGWGGVSHRASPPTSETWWMEGVTMYYADLVARRAGLPVADSSRVTRLARAIGTYLDAPGNALVSPEEASRRHGDASGMHEGPQADVYLQGRLAGTVLDLMTRQATANAHSLDDVMRTLMARDSGARGYTGADIERVVSATCGCVMRPFFADYIRGAHALPFARAFGAAGLRLVVDTVLAEDSAGHSLPDHRVWAYMPSGEATVRLLVDQLGGAWARAGLRTGDRVLAWNGSPIATMRDFRTALAALPLSGRAELTYDRDGRTAVAVVDGTPYRVHRVRVLPLPGASATQRAIRRAIESSSLPRSDQSSTVLPPRPSAPLRPLR